ncbi:MAG: cysteine synthase, partial [Chloroflexi bacterium RBG_16_64_43]
APFPVGHTPLFPLRRLDPELPAQVSLWAKAEWYNPSGSVKDRPAWSILRTALNEGRLDGGRILLDATSGNMGIAYATFAAALSVPLRLVIPANASPERIAILRALGADLALSSALEGSDGAILEARAIHAADPDRYFYADQYNNPFNAQAHYDSTGPEVWDDTRGQVSHFVAGLGTSGTMMGAGRFLRQRNPAIRLVAVQPDEAFNGLEGLKHLDTAIVPGIYNARGHDETRRVSTEAAHAMVLRLSRSEGLFVGVSAGAAAVAALEVARDLSQGVVVAVFPDSGHKYLSEEFWRRA